jgi:hypothetical protein
MGTTHDASPDTPLDRLVAALILWGATASQIVSHMELSQRSGASTSSRRTGEVFSTLMAQTLAPRLEARAAALDQAAALIEEIDATIAAEILMVPLPVPAHPGRGRPRRRPP